MHDSTEYSYSGQLFLLDTRILQPTKLTHCKRTLQKVFLALLSTMLIGSMQNLQWSIETCYKTKVLGMLRYLYSYIWTNSYSNYFPRFISLQIQLLSWIFYISGKATGGIRSDNRKATTRKEEYFRWIACSKRKIDFARRIEWKTTCTAG